MEVRGDGIQKTVIDAILAGRWKPGARLNEAQIASLFDVSRTMVREAMIRLNTLGLVAFSPRRDWLMVELSLEDVVTALQARRAVETGLLLASQAIGPDAVASLRNYVAREREAIALDDVATRSFLPADLHVCLDEGVGNQILADPLRDLTARTILVAFFYQSTQDAREACDEHEQITDAIAAGDHESATRLMMSHIDHVEVGPTKRLDRDLLVDLRAVLRPTFQPRKT